MASNDNKKKARRLQQANPGMKYTEALRHIEAGVKPGSVLLGTSRDDGNPIFLDSEDTNFIEMGESKSKGKHEILLDEWHDLTPSEEVKVWVNDLARKSRTPRVSPLRLGSILTGGSAYLMNPGEQNLAVCGNSMAGHTEALRTLARNALSDGWWVSVVDPKADEYRDLRMGSGRVHSPRDASRDPSYTVDQSIARSFIEHLTPGDAAHPHLVVIDNGDYIFTDDPRTKGGDGWKRTLTRLVDDPDTVVVIQCTLPVHRLLPGRILEGIKARLLLGHSSGIAQEVTFSSHAPQEAIESFDFNHPAWADTKSDLGRGVFWDGQRFQHVLVGGQSRTPWASRPLKDLVIGHTVGDITSRPVALDLPEFADPATGKSDDYLWVGTCATEEQAIRGWEMLGQYGERDNTVAVLMRLPANHFILQNRKTGFTEMIEVDAASLAALAGRRNVED